ncbi:MAG: acyl carrier protein [Bradymonadaceae bacterium]|nr:acyl carrier protein [Lujinxingiaceae bacterium]
MSKDQIIEVITRNLLENIDDLDQSAINPESSMRDYGANSLDIIEVVSCSMRELKIKVPRSELAEVQNISQLADKFLEYVNA